MGYALKGTCGSNDEDRERNLNIKGSDGNCVECYKCYTKVTFVRNQKPGEDFEDNDIIVGDAVYVPDPMNYNVCYTKLQFDSVAIKNFKGNDGKIQEVLFINGQRAYRPSCSTPQITIGAVTCVLWSDTRLVCTGRSFNVYNSDLRGPDDMYFEKEGYHYHSGTYTKCVSDVSVRDVVMESATDIKQSQH